MNTIRFSKELGLTLVVLFLLLFLVHSLYPPLYAHLQWTIACTTIFLLVTIMLYLMGYRAVSSGASNIFTGIILFSVLGRLCLAGILLYLYVTQFTPSDKSYVFSFIIIYLTFTFFETHLLMVISRTINRK